MPRTLSATNFSSESGFSSALVSWNRYVLLAAAAALGQEHELVGVAGRGVQVDLRRQVRTGVLLGVHVDGRHLRVAQVLLGVGVVHPARQRLLVVGEREHVLALVADDRGRPGVLAARQHAAGGDVRVLQQLQRHEAVVVRGLGVVEDVAQLLQVPGPQQVGDVDHRLPGQQRQRRRLDLQRRPPRHLERGHPVGAQLLPGRRDRGPARTTSRTETEASPPRIDQGDAAPDCVAVSRGPGPPGLPVAFGAAGDLRRGGAPGAGGWCRRTPRRRRTSGVR